MLEYQELIIISLLLMQTLMFMLVLGIGLFIAFREIRASRKFMQTAQALMGVSNAENEQTPEQQIGYDKFLANATEGDSDVNAETEDIYDQGITGRKNSSRASSANPKYKAGIMDWFTSKRPDLEKAAKHSTSSRKREMAETLNKGAVENDWS